MSHEGTEKVLDAIADDTTPEKSSESRSEGADTEDTTTLIRKLLSTLERQEKAGNSSKGELTSNF